MPSFKKLTFRQLLLSATALVLAGCGAAAGPGGGPANFEVRDARVQAVENGLELDLDQGLELSRPARRAMLNGVPLVLRVGYELRGETVLLTGQRVFELRYLPMSERFQLSGPRDGAGRLVGDQAVRTWPRLRHALRHLSNLSLNIETARLPAGEYELRTRIWLDRASLPSPMQLPAMVNRDWRHDSEWSKWPFRINA
ncbi:MAG: DUF4390 domain-containing protein [Xanthomonadales bacterium]|jgi:hypothetical protein|nr:DUF4390 domain-containing protein [Xanthomonadales bacterium]